MKEIEAKSKDVIRILSLDQSLSNAAYVIYEYDKDCIGKPVIIKSASIQTQSAKAKTQKSYVVKFNHTVEQIRYIASHIVRLCKEYEIDKVVIEQLALSGMGSASKDLAGLYYVILSMLIDCDYKPEDIVSISPTTIKAYARTVLPESEQVVEVVQKPEYTKTGKLKKQKPPKKIKMDKKQMIKVAEILEPDELSKYKTLASGKADISDAICIFNCYYFTGVLGDKKFQ